MSTKPYRPSNGTEGDFFIESQCGDCTKREGCRIVSLTKRYQKFDDQYPAEWVSDLDGSNARCTAREVFLPLPPAPEVRK